MAGKAQPIEARLKKHVVVDSKTGCHIWQKVLNHRGYGIVNHSGKARRAHRVAYELSKGPIPTGLQLDHLCRNRACINPDHLEPVTNAVNHQRGANAKLSSNQVDLIRTLRSDWGFKLSVLAETFGISTRVVSDITRNISWRM